MKTLTFLFAMFYGHGIFADCVASTERVLRKGEYAVHFHWCELPATPALVSLEGRLTHGDEWLTAEQVSLEVTVEMPNMMTCSPRDPHLLWLDSGRFRVENLDFYMPANRIFGQWDLVFRFTYRHQTNEIRREGICPEVIRNTLGWPDEDILFECD